MNDEARVCDMNGTGVLAVKIRLETRALVVVPVPSSRKRTIITTVGDAYIPGDLKSG